jgi:hypothetical protein
LMPIRNENALVESSRSIRRWCAAIMPSAASTAWIAET